MRLRYQTPCNVRYIVFIWTKTGRCGQDSEKESRGAAIYAKSVNCL